MSGIMTFIGPNLIDWQCSKQFLVALSTCEAEIAAIVKATRSAVYTRGLLGDLGFLSSKPINIWNDNQSASTTLTYNDKFKKTKHYARKILLRQRLHQSKNN